MKRQDGWELRFGTAACIKVAPEPGQWSAARAWAVVGAAWLQQCYGGRSSIMF